MRNWGFWAVVALACTGTDKTDDADTAADGDADTDADTDTGPTGGCPSMDDFVCEPLTEDPATVTLGGECSFENGSCDKAGTGFYADIYDDPAYSIVAGNVADGTVPVSCLFRQPDATAECRLLKRENPVCDPPCDALQTCDFDDVQVVDPDDFGDCIPFPLNQDLGAVTLCGMNEDVFMTAVQPGNQYFCTSTENPACSAQLSHPAFEPGSLIELKTCGTTFGEDIVLHGVGVEPLALEGNDEWLIRRGQDLPISWNDKGASQQSIVSVRLNIDQHGNTPVSLYCDFPDTGSAALPSVLLDALIDFGVTGFPNATISRRTVDSTTMGGVCVQFEVKSPLQPSVSVEGFVPCFSDYDCIALGFTGCNDVTYICE